MDRDIPIDEVGSLPELDTSWMPVYRQYKHDNQSWIPDFDIWSYLNLRADFDLAAAFTRLFWPEFVEVDGCVILKRNYSPESFKAWWERLDGDRRAVEGMLNHTHIWDLFLNSRRDIEYPEELLEYLVNTLMFGWKQTLEAAYPDKRFVFSIRYNPSPELSFYQE